MKPNLYTKSVLTVIALALTAIACNQYIEPKVTAQAQSGQFAGVQFAGPNALSLFDSRTGEIWLYRTEGYHSSNLNVNAGSLISKFRVNKLGQPLTVEVGEK